MARKHKSGKKRQKLTGSRKRKFNGLKALKNSLFFSAIVSVLAVAIYFYSSHKQLEYDLSVIGNGKPTVVQIHDPGCQLCQRLKRNLDSVKSDFTPDMQFKVANIGSKAGREFARQHNVEHVTLLLFDKRGKRVETLEGVKPASEIKAALTRLSKHRTTY